MVCWLRLRHISIDRSPIGLLSFLADADTVAEFCAVAPSLFDTESAREVCLDLKEDDGVPLRHRDILSMEPLERFIGRIEGDWLIRYLMNGRVESVFHPMVDPRSGRIEGYECLMRAVLPDGRIVQPKELIGTARSAGVMLQLDRIARVSAIRSAARNSIAENVFVNFNPSSQCDPEICLQSTVAAVEESGIHPSRVVFEVTESEYITDTRHLKKILSFFRSNGFKIALDDLGSGYSSLNLLTELRPDYVKLDMELIRGIDRDVFKQEVTKSLLEMSERLEIRTVVEGVESEGEWNWATEHGADLIQGFYFARPAFTPPQGPDLATWSHETGMVFRTCA